MRNNFSRTRTLSKLILHWPDELCWLEYSLIEKPLGNSSGTVCWNSFFFISFYSSGWLLLLTRGFSRSEYSNQQSSFGQCKIIFDRVLVQKKLFLKNYQSYIKSDQYSWGNIVRTNFCPKVTFGIWPFLWSNFAIFYLARFVFKF